jgi:hypothetical protein
LAVGAGEGFWATAGESATASPDPIGPATEQPAIPTATKAISKNGSEARGMAVGRGQSPRGDGGERCGRS